ncbi:MAG: class I SAM-dependent methyltransferase [Pirellulaceae bacterium]
MSNRKQTGPPEPSNDPGDSRAIRNWYQDLGIDEYYRRHGKQYQNPHLPWIQALIERHHARLDLSDCLDFCCGRGEVSKILLQLGYRQISGCDPYTQSLYEQQLGLDCLAWSFEDLLQGKLTGNYSCIISSFALHLCPRDQLAPLVWQLFNCTSQLVIVTPHKRPELEQIEGIELSFTDHVLTQRGKRIRLKIYHPLAPPK